MLNEHDPLYVAARADATSRDVLAPEARYFATLTEAMEAAQVAVDRAAANSDYHAYAVYRVAVSPLVELVNPTDEVEALVRKPRG